ncbi:hypothetical protein B0H10DRAFT_2323680 [Mycena sp. CBHHK59/15]|nr:hypothetical protein B0H10DRAFT_2323680 [Mycena sp. CBHHK59/15]
MTNVGNVKKDVVIEWRALMLTVLWHGELDLGFLAVYVPNNSADNAKFLDTLQEKMDNLPGPDFVC